MRPEYRFDYTQARPNRFAARMGEETVTVVLDPPAAAVSRSAMVRRVSGAARSARRFCLG